LLQNLYNIIHYNLGFVATLPREIVSPNLVKLQHRETGQTDNDLVAQGEPF